MTKSVVRNLGRVVAAALTVWGLYVVIQGLRGSSEGTDNPPRFTVAVGVVYLMLAALVFALTEHRRWSRRS